MVGAIVKRDILAHPLVTVRCFGWQVFFRALLAGSETTFLSLLAESEMLKPAQEGVQEFVARCVELELKVSRIYGALARRFNGQEDVSRFFAVLAQQEKAHAELLELAETAAGRDLWDESKVAPWRASVTSLEKQIQSAVSAVDDINSVKDALEHVIELESSEINDVFSGVIAASDSEFVKRIRAFRHAQCCHLGFICDAIGRLEPELAPASQVLSKRLAA